jgi:hypothetical protein
MKFELYHHNMQMNFVQWNVLFAAAYSSYVHCVINIQHNYILNMDRLNFLNFILQVFHLHQNEMNFILQYLVIEPFNVYI